MPVPPRAFTMLSSIGAAVLFRMLFNTDYGLPNQVLSWFGIDGPSWLGQPVLAMLVVILAQIWGDLPLSMLVILGGFLTLDNFGGATPPPRVHQPAQDVGGDAVAPLGTGQEQQRQGDRGQQGGQQAVGHRRRQLPHPPQQ